MEADSFAARRRPVGLRMAEVILGALAGAGAKEVPCGSLFLDTNGENYRANDWGHALVRARTGCRIDSWYTSVPAESFGETGTASPLLALSLAARAFAR